jgi:hypothetical protein
MYRWLRGYHWCFFLGRLRKERKENLDGRFGSGTRVFGFLILHGWMMAFTSLHFSFFFSLSKIHGTWI